MITFDKYAIRFHGSQGGQVNAFWNDLIKPNKRFIIFWQSIKSGWYLHKHGYHEHLKHFYE